MSELDLLNLAHASSDSIASEFGQIISITFAMVVGIFYFLNEAKLGLKIMSYAVYSIGMFLFLGMMIGHSNALVAVITALEAIPPAKLSVPGAMFLAFRHNWVTMVVDILINAGFWVLWLSVGYLLFFWRKSDHVKTAS
jgi:ABC-type Na+ efflux pump permease subunit